MTAQTTTKTKTMFYVYTYLTIQPHDPKGEAKSIKANLIGRNPIKFAKTEKRSPWLKGRSTAERMLYEAQEAGYSAYIGEVEVSVETHKIVDTTTPETPVTETPAEQPSVEEANHGRKRGPNGRFLPKENGSDDTASENVA